LLVNEEKIGIIDQKILSYTPPVKEKFAFGNGLRFQAQIEDLCLKCGIPKENRKNNISGSNASLPSLHIVSREVHPMAN